MIKLVHGCGVWGVCVCVCVCVCENVMIKLHNYSFTIVNVERIIQHNVRRAFRYFRSDTPVGGRTSNLPDPYF